MADGTANNKFSDSLVHREYAEQSIFKQPVVHGMLAAGTFSAAAVGCHLPDPGAIYMDLSSWLRSTSATR